MGTCSYTPSDTACAHGCSGGACNPGQQRFFITRETYDGELTPNNDNQEWPEADALCRTAGVAAGIGSGWGAWLWNPIINKPSSDQPGPPGPGPFYSMDGVTVLFPTGASLEAFPAAPVTLDEYGTAVPTGDTVWTGMSVGGQGSDDCCNWTNGFVCGTPPAPNNGTYGNVATTTQSWINAGSGDCTTLRHLYCLGTMP
jgi:hypothetical protein